MALELQLLGPFVAFYDGQPLAHFRSNKTQALLVYLVTEAAFAGEGKAQLHGREQLMALLWPGMPQSSAQVNLRQTLYQLRQMVPEVPGRAGEATVSFILSDRQQVQVNPEAHYQLDVARFLQLLADKRLGGDPSPDALAQVVALYRGPLLGDFYLADSESFEAWAAARRAALQRMALEALRALTEHHLQRAEHEAAERYARRQLALDELLEAGHGQLMRVLAQQGKRNAALVHYQTYRELLEKELGVAPSVTIEALYAGLREERGESAGAPAVARRKRQPLPEPATPFVGRRRELAAVPRQLEEGWRLVTLLGPGGSGKSRLAIEVARERAGHYRNGAAFVELAPLADSSAIPTAIATALDFRFGPEGSPREQVINYLTRQELLLVLDNFEHLLEGAGLVADLLQQAPGVHIVVTSRARLNLASECVFEVGGLGLPEAEDGFETAEAVEMFLLHARHVQPGFVVADADEVAVARICHLAAGMPLALELAANWVRYLSPAEIVTELAQDLDFLESEWEDLPERQRSMRAAFEHSWRLLAEEQRQALMKLSVFRGGASRRAARAVTGASLRTLVALADHSLLQRDPDSGRFAIHELIRQFAGERLAAAGAAEAVRDAHSAYYLAALADRLPDLKGRDQMGALHAIAGDFENVRAAWLRAVTQRQWQRFPEASQSLFLFTTFNNRQLDGIDLLAAVYQAIPAATTEGERLAYVYALANGLAMSSGVVEEEPRFRGADLGALMETIDDPAVRAYCQLKLGTVMQRQGRVSEAIGVLESALIYYEQAQEPYFTASTLHKLAFSYGHLGTVHAKTCFNLNHRALALYRQVGNRFMAGILLNNLGESTFALEGPSKATENYFREAVRLFLEAGAWDTYGLILLNLGWIILRQNGDVAASRALLDEGLAHAGEYLPVRSTGKAGLLAAFCLIEGNYEEVLILTEELLALAARKENIWLSWARPRANFQRGTAFLALGNTRAARRLMARGLAEMVEHSWETRISIYLPFAGLLLAQQGKHERAVALIAHGVTRSHARGQLEVDPMIRSARAELAETLGEERFAAAWERGRQLNVMAVARELLQELEAVEESG